jgi:hypothetical protein
MRAIRLGAAPVPRSPTKQGSRFDDILAAERAAHRDVIRHRKAGYVRAGRIAPAAAANQHDGPLGFCEQAPHFRNVRGARMCAHRAIGTDHRSGGLVAQHVFGQCNHDRPGPPRGRDLKRLVHQLGDALGHVDLRHPFRERRVHLAEIDFLKSLAVDLMARHLADQHDHRRRILKTGMHPDRGVAGAGPARHQQYPGLAGQLAVRFGHKSRTAFLAAGDEMDLRCVVERIEHFEIALTGDTERHLDAMRAQRRDNELTAALQGKIRRHRCVLLPDPETAL